MVRDCQLPLTPSGKVRVRDHLAEVLQSEAFRDAQSCSEFLAYLVDQALQGREEALKGKLLLEVFGGYQSPADDSTVRVRAHEVRRRLREYYQTAGANSQIEIQLPTGTYVPRFRCAAPRWRRWSTALAAAVALVAVAAVVIGVFSSTSASPLERFWQPVLADGRAVLLCAGPTVSYQLSSRLLDEYLENSPTHASAIVQLDPDRLIPGRDVVPVTDKLVSIGTAMAIANYARWLTRNGRDLAIRVAPDVAFRDLQEQNSVVIGAYNNVWTARLSSEWRFIFEAGNSDAGRYVLVRDRERPSFEGWRVPVRPGEKFTDYAIVTRVAEPATGRVSLLAAGLTQYGTQAVAEFLTVPSSEFDNWAASAPPQWDSANLQVVLKVPVVANSPGRPTVLATKIW